MAALTPTIKERLLAQLPSIMLTDSVGSSETGAQMSHVSATGGEVSTGRFTPLPGTVVVSEDLDKVLGPGHEGIGWLAQEGWVPLGYLGDEDKTARTFPVIGGDPLLGARRPGAAPRQRRHRAAGPGLGHHQPRAARRSSPRRPSGPSPAIPPSTTSVVGRASERWGQEVVALVELSAGRQATAEDIVDHAGQHVARYKLLKDVLFLPAIQRSPRQGRLPLGQGPGQPTRLTGTVAVGGRRGARPGAGTVGGGGV